LIWERPENGDGYEVVDCGKEEMSGTLQAKPGASFTEYEPLVEHPDLFIRFAEIFAPATTAACLRFANEFGVLHYGPSNSQPREGKKVQAEELRIWYGGRMLVELIRIWQAATVGDNDELSRFFCWENDTLSVKKAFFSAVPTMSDDEFINGWRRWHRPIAGNPPSLAELAISCCAFRLGFHSSSTFNPPLYRLQWNPLSRQVEWKLGPQDLWMAIRLQFSLALAGEYKFQKCSICGKWFQVAPGLNRSDKVTCSQVCRNKAYRQRQERARELHAQGMSAPAIASEIGAQVASVEKWVATKRKEQ
jgi:hypothetical protein